jgi:type VI secretion system protein ImpH
MATAGRGSRDPLTRALENETWTFEFHQAVRLLEAALGGAPVGRSSDPSDEAIRFRSQVSLAFPASEVTRLELPPEGAPGPARMEVAFLGLANALGPLPRPFTEWILERVAKRDTAFRDFLDIFNHRLVSYHYRSREKHRPGMRLVHPEESTVGDVLLALAGLSGPTLQNRQVTRDRALLPYVTSVGRSRPIAQLLAGTLTHHFSVPFSSRPFQGRWIPLEEGSWTRLSSRDPFSKGATPTSGALGQDAVLGTRIWDQSAVFELEAGPLSGESFRAFLPGDRSGRVKDGDWLQPVRDLVQLQAKPGARVQLRLTQTSEQVRPSVLTQSDQAPRLGYSSWLGAPTGTSVLRNVVVSL